MQMNFGKWENINEYKITNNYRSNSDIVIHSRALIEKNQDRISKDLRSDNPKHGKISVLSHSNQNLKLFLLKEISSILDSDYEKVGILARNWLGEINKIKKLLDCDELRIEGFDIEWEELEDPQDDFEDENDRRKLFLRKDSKVIEIMNIFAAKGREWDKVVLPVNIFYKSLPRPNNEIEEERRIFYIAVTRAKHELVILDGGNCEFVSEFQELPLSERKKQLKINHRALISAFENRINNAKVQLEKASQSLSATFKSQRFTLLIPVMNNLESIVNKTTEKSNSPAKLLMLSEKMHSTQNSSLIFLKNQGIRPIETIGKTFNSDQHEVNQPAMYSDEVPEGKIVKEFQRGYLLQDQVIQKAKVAISKGPNPWTTERLEQVVVIYLDRLISAFQTKYQFTNFEKPLVIEKMVKYLLELEEESIKEIGLFSSKSATEAIEMKRYADYCTGPEKIHLCTSVFQDFWNKMWEIIISHAEKDNKQADVLLSQDFTQPVRFITYSGIRDLTNIKTFQDQIVGVDTKCSNVNLEADTILFAFPKMYMDVLNPYV
ncbi:MAG: nucleotide exchange factor GrpE [Candidatus Poribacteria bacterium]|nr:nucleotide exchange factor GrpE [Candidatus Poribacteria bacterium]